MSAEQAWRVSGSPTDAELAAVVVALTAAATAAAAPAGGTAAGPSTDVSGWSAYWRGLRQTLPSGPGAWRASAL